MAKAPAALIVDQDVQSRYEMRQMLKASGLIVAGEAGYGMEAITLAAESRPDVVIVGVSGPPERPLQTVSSLVTLMPETPVITYAASGDLETARQVMLAGARDFLSMPVRPEALHQSVLKTLDAEEARRLGRLGNGSAPQLRGTVITVTGAKGGIGKSTVVTNLGAALARRGTGSVVLVDLDTGFGDVAGMLAAKPDRTIADLIPNITGIEADDLPRYVCRHETSGLHVLAAPTVLGWRDISPDDVRGVIEMLARFYDMVLIDTSGMLNGFAELAVEVSNIVLWVTTTEFASVNDTLAALSALRDLRLPTDRIRIVSNAVSRDDFAKPDVIGEILQMRVFWSIPYDSRVRRGAYLGEPVVISDPSAVSAKSFAELANTIAGGRAPQAKTPQKGLKWLRGAQPAAAGG